MNPYLPIVRARAVQLVRVCEWSVRQTARYLGVQPGTVSKWIKRAPPLSVGPINAIPTRSCRPHHSPLAVDRTIVDRIVEIRQARGRCAEAIHAQMLREGMRVSLSTVKRTLHRHQLIAKRSPWKKIHQSGQRPKAEKPGDLVQIDSIHLMLNKQSRIYIITLLDCHSRWAFARGVLRLLPGAAVNTVWKAKAIAPFEFHCMQSDHGSEFSSFFTRQMDARGIRHRHIRVRKPNDNGHVERFNRTLQEECRSDIQRYKYHLPKLNRALGDYLQYYNTERLHSGLGYKTPSEMFPSY